MNASDRNLYVRIIDLPKGCDVEWLHDDDELKICLVDDLGHTHQLVFEGCLTFQKMDEGDAYRSLGYASKSASGLGLGVYEVNGSDFLKEFCEETSGIRSEKDLQHYCVMTLNTVIHVIDVEKPNFVTESQ